VVYSVLEFREKKQTFAKVEGGNMDFFQEKMVVVDCMFLG
jgi:hypothetical protein